MLSVGLSGSNNRKSRQQCGGPHEDTVYRGISVYWTLCRSNLWASQALYILYIYRFYRWYVGLFHSGIRCLCLRIQGTNLNNKIFADLQLVTLGAKDDFLSGRPNNQPGGHLLGQEMAPWNVQPIISLRFENRWFWLVGSGARIGSLKVGSHNWLDSWAPEMSPLLFISQGKERLPWKRGSRNLL